MAHAFAGQDTSGTDLASIEPDHGPAEAASSETARPVPRISIQAFCDSEAFAQAVQVTAEDRRLAKAHVSVHMGGATAAVLHYQDSPTPNLIVLEINGSSEDVLAGLDSLAECCDAGTKVIAVGRMNDVVLYRELLRRGVGEYLIAPVSPIQLIESISNLYNDPEADPIGKVIAFIGGKGGVGSSTLCHNLAWMISETLRSNVVIADFDLAFGTTGLDFNHDPVQGIADALTAIDRLDEVLLDRLLTKCTDYLSIFAAPVAVDRDFEISPDACDAVVDVVRQSVPYVALDLPHNWSSWNKHMLLQADEIVITATPDLACLRNTKNLIDFLKQTRANDAPPLVVLNMVGMPRRPEISVEDFTGGLELQAAGVIEFDAEAFGHAANNGQMLAERDSKSSAVQLMQELANRLTHRRELASEPKRSGAIQALLEKLPFTR
ncbi:MAG: AAA family ATPase [Pseudomonadota bacterium]